MDDLKVKGNYKQFIPIEHLVTMQIDRIMEYRSKKQIELFEESVQGLIDLLEPDSEELVLKYMGEMGIGYDLSEVGKQKHIELFRFIKREWAKDNIIWKRSRSYERGHDQYVDIFFLEYIIIMVQNRYIDTNTMDNKDGKTNK